MKKQFVKSSNESEKITKDIKTKSSKLDEKIKLKLERIKLQAITLKERWDLEWYEKKLLEWLAFDPQNLEFIKRLADLYFSIWKYNKALPFLKKILEIRPEDDKAIWQLWKIIILNLLKIL